MLVVYTTPGCASCRKAKAWLKEKNIEFIEKNIFSSMLKDSEVRYLLSRTENGIDDIVSKRSKVVKELNVDLDNMSMNELIHFVRHNPSALKRPILINERNMLIGYDEEEIEAFNVKELNRKLGCECNTETCPVYKACDEIRSEMKKVQEAREEEAA